MCNILVSIKTRVKEKSGLQNYKIQAKCYEKY